MLYSKRDQQIYSDRIDAIAEAAGEAAVRAFDAMREADPDASVADIREGCIYIVESVLDAYGDMAAETAAQLYDAMAEASGAHLPPAEIPPVSDETHRIIEKQIRYNVGVLTSADGD